MKNIFSENDFIELYLEQIDSSCDDISLALDSGDAKEIESCVKTIQHASDELYRELESTEIPEETVALSVVQDFFDEHHIRDNLSMGDVIKLEKALKEWYASIR